MSNFENSGPAFPIPGLQNDADFNNTTLRQYAAIKMEAYRAMVDRFLSWKLPQDFGPDAGISFTPPPHLPDLYWPTGTNLFHAGQALEMFKHCVELPSAVAVRLAEKNLFDAQEAAKTITKQAIAAEAERDALAAKLKDAEHDRDDFRQARTAPPEPVNARLLEALKRAKDSLVAFKFLPGDANRWEESDEENLAAVNSAIAAAADARQERLLQDMHDASLEIDRVMVEPAPEAVRPTDYSSTVDRACARFCGAFGDGPDAPYPGMIAAFETHYGQSFRDKEWRTEAACWAAAWSKATQTGTAGNGTRTCG